jgi:hypothetical protein
MFLVGRSIAARWGHWFHLILRAGVKAGRILPLFHLTSKGPLTINRKALPLPRAGRFHLRVTQP